MEPELHSMVATLCSYESLFGPYHPQTLRLMVEVGAAYLDRGQFGLAEHLLERAIGDLGRFLGREDNARLRAIKFLVNLYVSRGELERAHFLEQELFECHNPETTAPN
jgi:hypothetical protein